jgi:hypothetical protein
MKMLPKFEDLSTFSEFKTQLGGNSLIKSEFYKTHLNITLDKSGNYSANRLVQFGR